MLRLQAAHRLLESGEMSSLRWLREGEAERQAHQQNRMGRPFHGSMREIGAVG